MNVQFHPIAKSLTESFQKHFTGYVDGMVRGEPGELMMSPKYGVNAKKIYEMKPREDDVWLVTFPKCGKLLISISYGFVRMLFMHIS